MNQIGFLIFSQLDSQNSGQFEQCHVSRLIQTNFRQTTHANALSLFPPRRISAIYRAILLILVSFSNFPLIKNTVAYNIAAPAKVNKKHHHNGGVFYDATHDYLFGIILISTRRFCWRPWAVALDAIGFNGPMPTISKRDALTPWPCR